ncbi:uncharacterized protein SCODWIG_00218 [Saccharomycodes ludwigii]|uniref:C-CAP/cofactor C-like domain-containing protein n=1 Tax=Saccharomycodes ludwigii TaxID=36035 RepID=A0A376B1B2_9ASCO|nr:hypothetical protein SCDLUD_001157 [Saccharomycodes ludwigii]KAH3903516.1 hypothetical protein SCDLUD_001157 [Saccharomycodes ludwigii]SSD58457.1 uncharacterized protein SCODWIG_00218 [Saccharomycodes ludwigii]
MEDDIVGHLNSYKKELTFLINDPDKKIAAITKFQEFKKYFALNKDELTTYHLELYRKFIDNMTKILNKDPRTENVLNTSCSLKFPGFKGTKIVTGNKQLVKSISTLNATTNPAVHGVMKDKKIQLSDKLLENLNGCTVYVDSSNPPTKPIIIKNAKNCILNLDKLGSLQSSIYLENIIDSRIKINLESNQYIQIRFHKLSRCGIQISRRTLQPDLNKINVILEDCCNLLFDFANKQCLEIQDFNDILNEGKNYDFVNNPYAHFRTHG